MYAIQSLTCLLLSCFIAGSLAHAEEKVKIALILPITGIAAEYAAPSQMI
jgi:hypothetical protein